MASPVRPEPKFFIRHNAVELGLEIYLKEFFRGHSQYRVLGEKSACYLSRRDAALRIKECLPNVKIIISLRDPTFRAISHYWFTRNYGLEQRSLSAAFKEMRDRKPSPAELASLSMSPYAYLEQGIYLPYISAYEQLFGRNNVYVLVLEEFVKSIRNLKELYKFVRVDSDFRPPNFDEKVHASEQKGPRPSKTLLKKLASYFYKDNEQLAKHCNINLREWQHP